MFNVMNVSLKEQERLARQQIEQGALYKSKYDEAAFAAKRAINRVLEEADLSFEDFDGDDDLRFLLAVDEKTGLEWRNLWFDKIAKKDEWMSKTYKTIGACFSSILYDEIKQLENHTDIKLLVQLVERRTIPLLTKLQDKYGQLKLGAQVGG